jgi:hypothetical protein
MIHELTSYWITDQKVIEQKSNNWYLIWFRNTVRINCHNKYKCISSANNNPLINKNKYLTKCKTEKICCLLLLDNRPESNRTKK